MHSLGCLLGETSYFSVLPAGIYPLFDLNFAAIRFQSSNEDILSMPREISVAFQGGGAKLIGLIAAAHTLWELERENKIRIRGISGTSAGSIAAFLLASNVDFERVPSSLRKHADFITKNFSPIEGIKLHYRLVRFLFSGKPIYNGEKFEILLHDVLRDIGIDSSKPLSTYVKNKRVYLMYSDIYACESLFASLTETVRGAIRRSSAIPVVFSTYKEPETGQRSDGGLLDNLPTDILIEKRDNPHPVFAIAFKPEPGEIAKNAWQYLYVLASAGIQQRVTRSKETIGAEKVLELKSSIDTLDFHKIITVGIDQEYADIKKQTRDFFEPYLRGEKKDLDPNLERTGRAPLVKLQDFEKEIYAYVLDSMQKAEGTNKYLTMQVYANSLKNPNDPDQIVVEQLIKFREGDYVKGLILPLAYGDGERSLIECEVRTGGPDGDLMPFAQFGINHRNDVGEAEHITTDAVVLLFKGDLRRVMSAPVYVIKRETRYGFMTPLQTKRRDYLAVRTHHWPVDKLSLELHVPVSFPQLRTSWFKEGSDGSRQSLPELDPRELVRPPAIDKKYMNTLLDAPAGVRLRGEFSWTES